MTQWQDISTAPWSEDVLLHTAGATVSCWIGHRLDGDPFGNWYHQEETTWNGKPTDLDPTHWQPLPEPPK